MAIIGSVGVPCKYGGFETLAHQLVLQLNPVFDLTVYNSGKFYPKKERQQKWQNANMVYIPLNANGVQSVPYDIIAMLHAIVKSDCLVVLGVSGCLFLPLLKLFSKKRIVVNIDGLEWRRAKWSKYAKWFLKFSEKMAVRYANDIVTDNAALQEYAAEYYGIKSKLIAYGGDHNSFTPLNDELKTKYAFLNQDYAFKVCRIEPENNIHIVLDAFENYADLPLVVVGNWDNSIYGKELKEKYENCAHIYLLNPIYEANLLNALRSNAKVYVHGHSAGGTNPSLVEAMYLGLAVIAFDVSYNRVTTHNEAMFFADSESLKKILTNLSKDKLIQNAAVLKKIADECYTWQVIAQKYAEVING